MVSGLVWADHNLKPWKVSTFKISNDPQFEAKLVDVVGLYMNPPKRAVVFSFDENCGGPHLPTGRVRVRPSDVHIVDELRTHRVPLRVE